MYLQETLRDEAKIRSGCALLAAALVPAAIFSCMLVGLLFHENLVAAFFLFFIIFGYAFLVAGGHLIAFGLPAFLLGLRLRAIHWWSCMLVSALIGGLPFTIWNWRTNSGMESSIALVAGFCGLIGGAIFWGLWRFWVRYDFGKSPSSSDPSPK
jgi:hypothetical protein